MGSLIQSLNLDQYADVTVDGDTILDLPAGVEVLRISIAANTPRIIAITGGSANRLFILMNATATVVQIVNTPTPVSPLQIWRGLGAGSKNIPAGEGTWIWFDGVHNYWRSMD